MASLTANHVGGWIYYSIAAGLNHSVNWKQLKLVIAGNRLLSARKNLVLLGNALTPESLSDCQGSETKAMASSLFTKD